ncbi:MULTISPECIES: MerR family transcriptional regulator [unclassified Brachybacterium]|uniref:MerR family transcriptional regulator n=1 Tax=unclassified Brachybacterium TaxID=2623841 RepID=UPI00360A33E4
MRISALAERTGVPVGTIKYYLREGLLAPGRQTSRTTAEYDESHVERIRLVRALTDAGGLGIAAVRRVVVAIDAPDPQRHHVLATAHNALVGSGAAHAEAERGRAAATDQDHERAEGRADPAGLDGRARRWASRRGWSADPVDPLLERLERAWEACGAAGIEVDAAMLDDYADAVEHVARIDVASVPTGADDAVRRVIVGTVMTEPMLATLRLLAQRQVAIRGEQEPG